MSTQPSERIGRLISTLHQQLDLQETYHNHKEKMAWTATSLFLAFTGLFITRIVTIEPKMASFLFDKRIDKYEMILFAVLLLIYILTNVFLYMQFSARWDSAEISHLLTKYLFKVQLLDENTARNLLHVGCIDAKDSIYPDEIMKRLRIRRTKRTWLRVVKLIPLMFCKKIDQRYKSELPSYAIAFVLAASQVLTVVYVNYR